MKRTTAKKRKTATTKARRDGKPGPLEIPNKTLADLIGEPIPMVPSIEDERLTPVAEALLMCGAPRGAVVGLPHDMEDVAAYVAKRHLIDVSKCEPCHRDHAWTVALMYAFRTGFTLALLRYADDLKNVPEAAALLEAIREGAKKGGAARREAAEPIHKAVRKRFRELRKTIKKKTARYLRVAEEFEMSDRQVQRIVDGMD